MGMGELRAPTPATIHSTLRSGASGQALPATSEIAEAFARIDTNGDGVLSRIEVIKACRADEGVRMLLRLPQVIRQEDGTRDVFERVFQRLDADDSKEITLVEVSCTLCSHATTPLAYPLSQSPVESRPLSSVPARFRRVESNE